MHKRYYTIFNTPCSKTLCRKHMVGRPPGLCAFYTGKIKIRRNITKLDIMKNKVKIEKKRIT